MSWYNAVAGSDVLLSDSMRGRLGVNGYGVDDVGVIANARSVEALMRLGSGIGALDEASLDVLLDSENGSPEQVSVARDLGERTLTGLSEAVSSIVEERMQGVPGADTPLYTEYAEWARNSLWEFPVGLLDTDRGKCFCLCDDAGLSVISIPVTKIDGRIGDVLVTLVHLLAIDGLKTLAHEALEGTVFMGQDASLLVSADGLLELRGAEPSEVVAWLEKTDPDLLREIGYWDDSDEAIETTACAVTDIAIAYRTESEIIDRVIALSTGSEPHSMAVKLAMLREVAMTCPDTILRQFVVAACDRLKGPASSELMGSWTDDTRFEYLPGQLCIVDTGLDINSIDDRFQYLNEAAMNADDLAILPLESEFEAIVPYLARVTLCERLLIAVAALLDGEPSLSDSSSS